MHQRSLHSSFWRVLSVCWCAQACCAMPEKGVGCNTHLVQDLDFEYLKIGVNVSYQNYMHRRGSAHVRLRIKKDQLIWFSILGPWGIEMLRGVATPARVTLLNRMQKTCTVYDYATLSALWPGPWDYAVIQAVLLGSLGHADGPHVVVQQDSRQVVIQQTKAAWTLTSSINPTLKKIEKLVATARQGSFVATYNQFKPCQGSLLFGRATLTWYDATTSTQPALILVLKGIQAQKSAKPLHFPLLIPTQYEKK